jgi:general secretion pathway protein A
VLLCAVAAALLYHQPLGDTLRAIFRHRPTAPASGTPGGDGSAAIAAAAPPSAEAGAPAAQPPPPARPGVADTAGPAGGGARLSSQLKPLDGHTSRMAALRETLNAWGAAAESKSYLEAIDDDATFFNLSAKAAGFLVQRIEADLPLLRNLDMPAILEFRTGAKRPSAYLVLAGVADDGFRLNGTGTAPITVAADEIQQHWTGVAYILWRNFLSIEGTIPGSAPPDSIVALKMLLRELGHRQLPLSREFDSVTQKTIEQVQGKYGLPVDGVVGPLTKIILYREGKSYEVPRLAAK